ncbi:MAG TPA: M20/M25/M40 family metallo-hydrolase [Candidatus Hydrogenedentes bacterium]|nr:M20/M25/M40 family metallo-hydrolase [Candidatus Hydrogenedentota bacterium]
MRNLIDREGIRQIQEDMAFMCSTVGTRLAGSPEEERVADYMAGRLRALGLGNVEKLPFSCKRWLPGAASVRVAPDGPVLDAQQVTHSPATPPEGIEGALLFLEPVDWENGLRCGELDGKIGLFLGGYGESERVFAELHQSGLAALLFVDTRMQTAWPIANGVGERFMKHITKPMAYLSLMDAYGLARERAARVRLTCSGVMKDATSWNAAGELPGDDPGGRVIVVSGHLDSVSIGQGADDNASGIAATLECARRLRGVKRKHTLRFIGFGAEEQLSVGSNRYVNEQAADLDRIAWVCNFDSIGAHFGLSEVMCTGTPEMEAYVRGIADARMQYGTAYADVCPYQDQFWFAARGIPGVWFSRNTHLPGHWYHHSEYNNLDAVSCEEIAWTSETACVMLEELAGSSAWPFPRAIASDMREKADGYLRELF